MGRSVDRALCATDDRRRSRTSRPVAISHRRATYADLSLLRIAERRSEGGARLLSHTHTNVTVRSHLSADVTFGYEFINFSVNYFARTHIAAATKYASSAISSCTNPGKVTGFGADVAKGRVNSSFVNLRVTIRLYQGTLNVIELHGHRLIIDSHSSTNLENLAKIGQVDFETIGLTGIVKNKK